MYDKWLQVTSYPMPMNKIKNLSAKTNKCDTLRDLVPFLQFKKRKNTSGGVLLLVKLQALAWTLLKETLLHGYFPRFLSCTNDTKSRNASHT